MAPVPTTARTVLDAAGLHRWEHLSRPALADPILAARPSHPVEGNARNQKRNVCHRSGTASAVNGHHLTSAARWRRRCSSPDRHGGGGASHRMGGGRMLRRSVVLRPWTMVMGTVLIVTGCGSFAPSALNTGLVPQNVSTTEVQLQRFGSGTTGIGISANRIVSVTNPAVVARLVQEVDVLSPTTKVCPSTDGYEEVTFFTTASGVAPMTVRMDDCGVVYATSSPGVKFQRSSDLAGDVTQLILTGGRSAQGG